MWELRPPRKPGWERGGTGPAVGRVQMREVGRARWDDRWEGWDDRVDCTSNV